jgi:hypothetical protein
MVFRQRGRSGTSQKDERDFQRTGNLPLVISANKGQRDFEEESFYSPDPITQPPQPDYNSYMAQMIAALRGSSGSSGSSGAMTAQQKLDEQIRQQRIRAMQGFLGGGGPEQSLAGLRGSLNNMIAAGEGDVEGVYGRTMGNIASGYGAAENLTQQGYDQLSAFLSANPNNPYSGFSAEAGAVSNPLEQVLGAYGVDAPEAQAMLQAEMAAGQSGASNFNALVDVLSRSAEFGATSRASEMQMARNFATTSLGQQRASYESQAAGARQQALAQLAQMRAQREFEIQQSVDSIRQRIIDELLGIGGTIGQGSSPAGTGSFNPDSGDNPRVSRV